MWISRWGVGFPGSRVTPFVGEPLSETRVPDIQPARAPPCSPEPAFPAGAFGNGVKNRGKGRPACSLQASRCLLSYTGWEERQWD